MYFAALLIGILPFLSTCIVEPKLDKHFTCTVETD